MEENRAAVLSAYISALHVQTSWIVVFPKYLEQVFITDQGRVKFHLYHFGVARFAFFDFFIGGRAIIAAHIAAGGIRYAIHLSKKILYAPETAGTKGC